MKKKILSLALSLTLMAGLAVPVRAANEEPTFTDVPATHWAYTYVEQAAEKGWMNTIHAHGTNIMFELLKDYPVQVFNWHAWETLPTVDEAYVMTGKCLMGGLNRTDITQRNRGAIQHQIFECYRMLGGRNQILTPGCVIRYPLDKDTLTYVKQAKDMVEQRMRKQ